MSARCPGACAGARRDCQTAQHFAVATWGTCQTIRQCPYRPPPPNRYASLRPVTCCPQLAAIRILHVSEWDCKSHKGEHEKALEVNWVEANEVASANLGHRRC